MSTDNDATTPIDDQGTVKARPARMSKGQRRLWWLRAVVLLVGAPVLMAAIAAVMLIGREVSAPSWIVRDVEQRAAEVLAGGSLEFGAMTFTVGTDLHPRLVLRNAVLRDGDGGVLARVPRVEGQISPRGVAQGRVLAQVIRLDGAQLSLRRARDGTVALAFDQGASAIGAADGFLGLLEQVDQLFEAPALEALEQVSAEGLIINYVDARAGRSWVVDDGRISLDLQGGQTALRASLALLSGRSYVTTAELSYSSPRGSRAADIGLSITEAAAEDIAGQSPQLSWLAALEAPISGALRGQLDGDGILQDVSATLQIGAGELRPTPATRPIPFRQARTYLRYDPARERLTFDLLEIDSDWGRVSGSAQTYLREYNEGWPAALLGQIQFSEVTLSPDGLYAEPVVFSEGTFDFRLRQDPFTLDIGQAVAVKDDTAVRLRGQIAAAPAGWAVSLDAQADEIALDPLLALWPVSLGVRTREWLAANIAGGLFSDVALAYRLKPDAPAVTALAGDYTDAQVTFMRTMPPLEAARGSLSIMDRRFALTVDAGTVTAPQGGTLDLAGSTMVIPRLGIPNPPARFDIALSGRMTAAMALLNEEPFNVLRNSDLPVSFAQGRASVEVALDMPLGQGIEPAQRVWSARATVRDVRTDRLVPDRVVTSSALTVRADPESLVVQGPVRLSGIGATITFSRALGAGSAGTGRLEADVTINPAFLSAFNIGLPDAMVRGESAARLALDLADPRAPQFRLTSTLQGTALNLAGLGWSKPPNASGRLEVQGQLGAAPRIDALSISAPGLQASGSITLAAGGGLERAAFDRVQLGGWLDAPVVLLGRGQGRPAAIQIAGGVLDLRDANFGGGAGSSAGAAGGGTGPIDIALNRLQIADGIALTNFRGNFTTNGGLQGQFSGQVNDGTAIRGEIVPVRGRSAVRIESGDAGGVLRSAGVLRNAYDGALQLTLLPAGAEGSYDGTLIGSDVRVRDAPALASLLDAISVVGLLTQMDGQGLLFNDVNARFRMTPNQIIVTQSSATGPGLGISLDGIYSQASRSMDFQGVVSPFYLLNGIGAVLTRPGEGLIGFNFNLSGPVDNPQVSVNPLSALTPGMFREIFRRPPPTVGQ